MRTQKVFVLLATLVAALGLSWGLGAANDAGSASAHTMAPYRVVFEVNDPAGTDNANWVGVLNNVSNSLDELGEENMQVEVVAHGPGINLLNKAKSPVELQARIAELQDRGVVFAACANSMAKNGYTMEDMVDGAVQVPSGAAEVIRKQQEGWLYMHS